MAAAVALKAKARGGSATAALQRAEEAGAAKPTGGPSSSRLHEAAVVASTAAAAGDANRLLRAVRSPACEEPRVPAGSSRVWMAFSGSLHHPSQKQD